MVTKNKEYSSLISIYKEIMTLDEAMSILSWDQNTYMPPGAIEDRAAQLSLLSSIIHQRYTSEPMGKLLKTLKDDKKLDAIESTNVREIARSHDKMIALPDKYVRDLSNAVAMGFSAWVTARKKEDFSIFKPHLSRLIELKKQETEYLGYKDKAYDALLDYFEPYMLTRDVIDIFSNLRKKQIPLVKKILNSGVAIDDSVVKKGYDLEKQKEFCTKLISDLGYDLNRGRMDIAPHPFTTGAANDVRITNRYYEDDIRPGLFACIHETGHALYGQGFLKEHFGTPMAQSVSHGIDESQSLTWENIVGRSRPYWEYQYPFLQKTFPSMNSVSLDDFYRAVNKVEASFIRTEADEATYNIHVIIRFEIECDIFDGKLKVDEIPSVWNEKYEQYLGITPPNDSLGCMQDVHWSEGLFGYFPTYALGKLYASQFYNSAKKELPDLEASIKKGNTKLLLDWLRKNIHNHGMQYSATELSKRITGKPLDENFFIDYLKQKYGPIYGITL